MSSSFPSPEQPTQTTLYQVIKWMLHRMDTNPSSPFKKNEDYEIDDNGYTVPCPITIAGNYHKTGREFGIRSLRLSPARYP
jgi:hypothetical protein